MRDNWSVRAIKSGEGMRFIRRHHYSHSCHNGPLCWGLFEGDQLIGVCAFATPGSEAIRESVFGPGTANLVTELHRLFVLDGTPPNTESWFISRAIAGLCELRPNLRAVISFADSSEGHVGTIYQATNALYFGTTTPRRFWRDPDGRLRHPRQNGHNVTAQEAKDLGWVSERRQAKHRYVFLVGTPAQRRASRKILVRSPEPYPKVTHH